VVIGGLGRHVHELAVRMAALYDELSATPGPSEVAARHARERGWAPPLAWDDIDDPEDRPQGVARERESRPKRNELDDAAVESTLAGLLPRKLTRAERLEVQRRLRGKGISGREAAELMGIDDRHLRRDRSRMAS
jgi:cobalamin biosynthesis protein CbiG